MNWKPLLALLLGGTMAACTPEQGSRDAAAGDGAAAPAALAAATPADEHAAKIEQWRRERAERLRRPDGWLSLLGLHWLAPGSHSIGRDAGNDIVLAVGPPQLGTIELRNDGSVLLTPLPGAPAVIDDVPAAAPVVLVPDSSGAPTRIALDDGRAGMMLIERSGRLGLRVRDANAPTRTGFVGIDNFDIDPSWRIDARFEPHPPGKTIDIASVINTLEPMPNPGAVVFERDGRSHRLEAVDEGDGQLFLIFADRTSGKSTYGAGRFLYADPPAAGNDRVVVDFNRAYNPPCALNAYSTCPLPPPENRLDLEVTAGEKTYRGPTH